MLYLLFFFFHFKSNTIKQNKKLFKFYLLFETSKINKSLYTSPLKSTQTKKQAINKLSNYKEANTYNL